MSPSNFFTNSNPDHIEATLLEYLKSTDQLVDEPVVNDKKYKVKFTMKTYDNNQVE